MKREIAVQSYCYRGFTSIPALIERVKATGLSSIEVCGVHVDFADRKGFDERMAELTRGGVKVMSIGVNQLSGNAVKDRQYFESARAAKLPVMSIDIDMETVPESLRAIDAMAEIFDIRVAIHNHGGAHWLGNADALRWVFHRTSPRVGLNLDTAWAMHGHADPLALAKEFSDRLYLAHVKDFTFNRAGDPSDVVVGTGNLSLKELDRLLAAAPALQGVVLEYEGDVKDPVPALRECVAKMRAEMPGVS